MSVGAVRSGAFRTDEELEPEALDEDERDVVEAEDFVIFGRANIEQWDDPEPGDDPIYVEMEALEESLDQLFEIDNISWMHKDVRVGRPLREFEADEATTIDLGDEDLHVEPGDVLEAGVVREGEELPGTGNGTADEDALWLPAHIFGRQDDEGSRISERVRLQAYYGGLDGYSVTIDKREIEPVGDGLRVTDVDFLATTVGSNDIIKNEGSTFGVAAFEALIPDDPRLAGASEGPLERLSHETIMGSIMQKLFGESTERLATEAIGEAYGSDKDIGDAVSDVAPEGADESFIRQEAERKTQEIAGRLSQEQMDRDELAEEVADEFGMSPEEVQQIFDELEAGMEEMAEDEEGEEPPEDDEPPEPPEDEELDEEAVEEKIDERVGELEEELDDRIDDLEESIADDIGQMVSSELSAGSTPGPAGGGGAVGDVEEQAKEWADMEDNE